MTRKLKVKSSKLKVQRITYSCLLPAACCLLFIILFSCSPQKENIYRKSKILMDTVVTINVIADSADKADSAMDSAFGKIEKLDGMLTFFSDKSELSMINKNAGISKVKVSAETLDVIESAVYTSKKTGGAFDVTIGSEISLWDFSNKKMPDDESIKKRLRLVNYRGIIIDREKSTAYLNGKGMLIDLGGIAKGYAADRAVVELKKYGITSGLVSVAGDVKAFGIKPDGKSWKVGIRNPRATGDKDEILATIELNNMAISTSGDYERYFMKDGKRYHHILDPVTGYPARGCQSVSVMAKNGVNTDSFSTGVFVLGPEKGIEVLGQMGFEGVIVDNDGRIHTTPGLRGKIEFKRNN